MDSFLDGRRECEGIHLRPHLDHHQRVRFEVLGVRNVEVGLRPAPTVDLKLRVASDSNDFQPAIFLACHAEGVADCILLWPELPGRAVADDRHVSAVLIVRASLKPRPPRRSMPITLKYSGEITLKFAFVSAGLAGSGAPSMISRSPPLLK